MIVVEGPDGSGKTTLAELIADEFDLEYRRAPTLSSTTGPDEAAIDWFADQMRDSNGQGGVYDRLFVISEPIYQLATPGRPLMRDAAYMALALQKVWQKVDLLIFCLPPWEAAVKNLEDVGRAALHGVDRLQLEKIHWMYSYQYELFKQGFFELVTQWDYTRMSHDHIKEAVSESL